MKVSVSLPGADVQFLDEYAKEQGLESRSAALHRAVRLLRTAELGASYGAAWAPDWVSSPTRSCSTSTRRCACISAFSAVVPHRARGSRRERRQPRPACESS